MTKEIKDLLKESEKDPIEELYKKLIKKSLAISLIPIYIKGKIVAKKILCKLNSITEVDNDWITAWHGTNFNNLESIVEIGLKPPGGKLKNGEEIQVCVSHISRELSINNIHDWANGIFVSPSIFYSACPAYAKEISCNNEQWKVLVEVKVKPNSYYEGKSTCSNYVPKNGEPEMLEYRIDPENERDVQVYSLTFVRKNFFEKAKNYSEGDFLSF